MTDAELADRLRRACHAKAATTVVTLDEASLRGAHPAGRRPRRPTVPVSIAAAVLMLLAAVAVTRLVQGDADEVATRPPTGRWHRLPDPPVSAAGPGRVWTGTELIQFGGSGASGRLTAAVAYDPRARSWRRLPDLPRRLAGAGIGVWTGHQVVVFGAETPGVTATYDPRTDQWHEDVDPAIPSLMIESFAYWTGSRVLVVGFGGRASDALGRAAGLYDPATGRWERLPDAPEPLGPSSDAVWTGRELLFVGRTVASAEGWTVLALDPATRRWRTLPAPPLSAREVPLVAWAGSRLIVSGGSTSPTTARSGDDPLPDGAALDPATGAWTPYPSPPVAVYGNDIHAEPVVVTVAGQVVVLSTGDPRQRPLILDPSTRRWRLGPPPPHRIDRRYVLSATATDHEVLVWSGGEKVFAYYAFTPGG